MNTIYLSNIYSEGFYSQKDIFLNVKMKLYIIKRNVFYMFIFVYFYSFYKVVSKIFLIFSIAQVIKNAGCEVPDYIMKLKKAAK